MNDLGWAIFILLFGMGSCSAVMIIKEGNSFTSKACYEQTKDIKCWDIK